MYLLNKVRALQDKTVYEIVDYNIETPSQFRIKTVDRAGLSAYLSGNDTDFSESGGFLLSSAETVTNSLFLTENVDIKIGADLCSLLIELVKKDAFFIPSSMFEDGAEYVGKEVSNFANIRVSSSSMYVGFSLLHGDSWASSKILFVDNGELAQQDFCVALPEGTEVDIAQLHDCGSVSVNGIPCRCYHYNKELPVAGEAHPGVYLPTPLFNYLNLQFVRCYNAYRCFSEIFEQKGIQLSSTDYEPRKYHKAVTITSSIKNISKKRRNELFYYYARYDKDLDAFVQEHRLNPIEHYVFSLFSKLSILKTTDAVFALMKALKVNRSLYSLALMILRCQVFVHPDCFFPQAFSGVVARGGGGGDSFTTRVEINNY